MSNLNNDFTKLMNYKNKDFNLKKRCLLSNIGVKYYTKKKPSSFKIRIRSDFFKIFKEFESISFSLPKIFKINLKYVNKKKKLKTKMFIKIVSVTNKNTFDFFDFFFVKYLYFYIKKLENLQEKKFVYLQEINKNKIQSKIKLKYNSITFNAFIFKYHLNFSRKIYNKKKNPLKRLIHKMFIYEVNRLKRLKLKIKLSSKFANFFFIFITRIVLNLYKINLYLYKKFLSKKVV